MAWHHHVERIARGARHHGTSLVTKWPTVAAVLGVVGIVAIGEVIFGKNTTPAPNQQDKTGGAS